MENLPMVMTPEEVADVLRCSVKHVYALAARGELAKVPGLGRLVRIPRWSVEERIGRVASAS